MTKDTLMRKVSFILNPDMPKELQVIGFLKDNNTPWKLNIDHAFEVEIIKVVAAGVKTLLQDAVYQIVDFSTADERKDRYYKYDLEEIPEGLKPMQSVIGNADIEDFDMRTHQLTDLDHLIMVLSDGAEHKFSIYKQLSSVEKISKSEKSLLARLDLVNPRIVEETKPMLRIGPSFQAIWVDGSYIVLNDKFLESNFKILDILNNEAKKKITVIEGKQYLLDTKKLKKYTDNTAFSRKLVKVLKDSLIVEKNISRDKLIEFIEGDAELRGNLPTKEKGGVKYINITKKSEALALLDLLNDEFVYSELTDQKYKAPDKDRRG